VFINKKYFKGLIIPVLLLAFCNDGGEEEGPLVVTPGAESFGAVTVTINANSSLVSIGARFNDGATPQSTVWDEVMKSGDCRLLTPRKFTCLEGCGSSGACVQGDTCQPYPTSIDVGALTVNGLQTTDGKSTISMKAVGMSKDYQTVDEFKYPAFAEGDAITVSAAGSAQSPAFTLSGKGISPIKVLDSTIALVKGKDIDLKWTPPATPGNSSIYVLIDITYHGGTRAKIECETADDGELKIPAAMLDKLQTYGLSGFPRIDVERHAVVVDEVVKSKLLIVSTVTYGLAIEGLISCNGVEDCPAGEGYTCTGDRRCEKP